MSLAQLEKIRRFELAQIAAIVERTTPKGARLLDIGAGTGWQARHFADAGYDVTAIDMPSSVYLHDRVFPIVEYDGHRIPAGDATFDAIYSSNVLEHIAHADAFQREIRRVLKPGGVVVHVVPSGSWRLHSNLSHYPYILKRAAAIARRRPGADAAAHQGSAGRPADSGGARRWEQILFPARDGEVGNALTEIWHFSRWRWRHLFERNGWRVESRQSNHLFYTAKYLLGSRLSIAARSRLSRIAGGSCHVFVLRPKVTVSSAFETAAETARIEVPGTVAVAAPASAPLRRDPRVLLVGPQLAGGGAQNRFRLAAQHMFGGRVSAAVLNGGSEAMSGLPVLDLGRTGIASYPRVIAALRRHIANGRYDAVLGFGIYPNIVVWGALLGQRRGPVMILSEINSPRREYLEDPTSPRGRALEWLRHRVYRSADFFAANSIDGIADAVTHYGVAPGCARRLPNLADPAELHRLAREPAPHSSQGVPSICLVSRLWPRKRVDTLLDAAARLPRDIDWQIDIVGDGGSREALEQRAGRLGLSGRVVFHGWLANPHPLVARASASVLCSEYEGFSNSVLEAMMLGVPVVTSLCTSDAADMVEKGAALGFAIGDDAALAAHLTRLLTDAQQRRQLSQAARIYARVHELPGAVAAYERLVLDAIAAVGATTGRTRVPSAEVIGTHA